MLKHKNINKICWVAVALVVVIAILFTAAASLGWIEADNSVSYENRLFDTSRVHTIDIVMDDWDSFIETATMEEYSSCTIIIDGEKYANVGIRAKGNTSLSQVAAYGSDRYSFKVEFDQYDSQGSYYGLDKLSLNNLIQDNTYMKDYLTYQMMNYVGTASPLTSYAYITVNGEDWGLYLAVEAVEDGFLQRNYGNDYGELYKPDSMSMGGGRGNGRDFNIDDFMNDADGETGGNGTDGERMPSGDFEMPSGGETATDGFDPSSMFGENGEMPEDFDPSEFFGGDSSSGVPQDGQTDDGFPERGGMGNMGGGRGGMGQSDVMLQYVDDDPDSYPNIFGNAKTDITDADQARLIESLKKLSEGEAIEDVVDVDSVIKYLVAHDFVQNGDSYTGSMVHNYYLYEENGVLSMIPWDYNLAFGGFAMGGGRMGGTTGATSTVNSPIDSPVSGGNLESRPMVAWIFESEEYTALYHQYYAEFIAAYFDSGYFEQMMDETVALISPYVEKDPTAFCSYEEFLVGVETLREFCLLRAESVSEQLNGTIPSTQDGQNTDSTELVDASHLNLSDMGSMGGMGRGGFGSMGNMPDRGEMPAGETSFAPGGIEQSDENTDNPNEISSANENELQTVPGTDNSDGEVPSAPNQNSSQNRTGGGKMPGGGDFDMSQMPDGFESSDMRGGSSQNSGSASTVTQWILLGGSVLLLMFGLLIAMKFKR